MIEWPSYLIEDIAKRKTVIFLGAGISKNSTTDTGERPPDWEEFLRGATSRISGDIDCINKFLEEKDYLTACEIIKNKLGHNFNDYAKERFLRPRYKTHEIHKTIFKLDSGIVATPNVDKIYDTFATQESQGTTIVKNYYDNDVADLIRGKDRLIIKVHGTIDAPNNMIFTRQGYAQGRCKYGMFYNILSALTLTHTFIFLGCGFQDPDIRLILENYTFMYPNCRPHYMVTSEDGITEEFRQVMRENCNLELLTYSSSEYHKELGESLKELVGLVEGERSRVADEQGW